MEWPPNNVVNEHKRRANCIWASLVMLIIGYSLWLIISTYEKRKNPAVSIWIEDDRYTFPTITLCAFAGDAVTFGCDSSNYHCAQTMYSEIINPIGFENVDGEAYASDVAVMNEEVSSICVDLDLSDMAEKEDKSGYPLRLSFTTFWDLNNGTGNTDEDLEHSEGVYVYFTDPEIPNPLGSHDLSTFVGVIPFTRVPANETPYRFTETDITMKLTESTNLDGTNTKTYSAGTISSKDYLIPDWAPFSSTQDTAVMFMNVLQPILTHTIRKEVDPLEWAELLGSIGGTWEILLILWGIFFIAIKSSEPEFKGRNFVKTVKRGRQSVARGVTLIASTMKSKRGSGDPSPTEGKETMPTEDTTSDNSSSTGGRAQASSDNESWRSSITDLIYVPSHNIPLVDDLPRPKHKPL